MPGARMLRSRTSRSKKPVLEMYPVSNSPISVASHAKPFGSGSARPMNAEDLELALEVRAVVGEHVHEVVLREVRRRAARRSGQAEPAARRTSPTRSARAFRREASANAVPPRRELRVDLRRARTDRAPRPPASARLHVGGVADVFDEAVALEIHPRQPVRALRVPARDAHEVVLHAERVGVLRDAVRDDDRDRSQHELAEHHVMDDPLAVAEVARRQHVGELVGPERLERPVVDRRRR